MKLGCHVTAFKLCAFKFSVLRLYNKVCTNKSLLVGEYSEMILLHSVTPGLVTGSPLGPGGGLMGRGGMGSREGARGGGGGGGDAGGGGGLGDGVSDGDGGGSWGAGGGVGGGGGGGGGDGVLAVAVGTAVPNGGGGSVVEGANFGELWAVTDHRGCYYFELNEGDYEVTVPNSDKYGPSEDTKTVRPGVSPQTTRAFGQRDH